MAPGEGTSMTDDLVVLTTDRARLIGPARTLSTVYNAETVTVRVQNFQYALTRRRLTFIRVGLLSLVTDSGQQRIGIFEPKSDIPEPYHTRLIKKLLECERWHQADASPMTTRFVAYW